MLPPATAILAGDARPGYGRPITILPDTLRSLLLCLTACLLAAWPLHAQDPPQQPEITVSALQGRLDALASEEGLAADLKTALQDVWKRALESAKASEKNALAKKGFVSLRESASARLGERKAELEALAAEVPGPGRTNLSLTELEQGLAKAQQRQTSATQKATDLDKEVARRTERRNSIPAQVTGLRAEQEALPAAPAEAPDIDARLTAARRLALLAERTRLQTAIDSHAAELQVYEAEAELMRTERDLAARLTTATKADVDAWQAALQPLRAAAARAAEQDAAARLLEADPRLQNLAAGNAELASSAARVVGLLGQAEADKAARKSEYEELQRDFEEVKKRADLVGATSAIGLMLRQRRAQIDQIGRQHRLRTKNRGDQIADAQLGSLEFDERRRRLVTDPEAWLQQQLGSAQSTDTLPAPVLLEARRLRELRKDLLTRLTSDHESLFNTLFEVQSTERDLTKLINTYRSFVTERVFGIRSSPPVWRLDVGALGSAIAWFSSAANWAGVGSALVAGAIEPVWPIAIALLLLLLFGARRFLTRNLVALGETAGRGSNVVYGPTLLAAVDTVLIALPLPALLWLTGYSMARIEDSTEFAKAVAIGLQQLAFAVVLVTSLRALVRAKGLAESHFRWQSTTLAKLRPNLRLLFFAVFPFTFLLSALEASGNDTWLGSLGGLLLLAQLTMLGILLHRLLHPTTGIIGGAVQATSSALFRFRRLFALLGTGTVLALFTMVALGYDYTALQLVRRLFLTIGVVIITTFVHAMIQRRLVLERRRLQIQRAKERLEAAKAADGATPTAADMPPPEVADPRQLAERTQALLRGAIAIGFLVVTFQVWVDVLPALGILRRFTLWTGGTEELPEIFTLADVGLAMFALLIVFAASRNVPALLELFVLQRFKLLAGERSAITTLTRYGIIITGLALAFTTVGFGWSKVQWLVAGVSVGLGFGLQEIFANFVSGLILLFEQPIRVGDLVSVNGTLGRVTRIQIRATTIQDWERKERVVPNRVFVTESFVNWTLGDATVRYTVPVGVAYGTDTKRALQLLEQSAKGAANVLADPAPNAIFTSFGDSALNLELRVFVDMNLYAHPFLTQVLQNIDRLFREAGIEIAFPQQDVHLKMGQPLLEAFQRSELPRAGQRVGDVTR